jgi:hypothetical protein
MSVSTGPSPRAGPGVYFASHQVAYRLSLAGSGGAAVYALVRAARARGSLRSLWVALVLLESGVTAGIVYARNSNSVD